MLSGVEEEKDPRNLVLTYDLIYFILRSYANTENSESSNLIEPFIEDLFDKVSCYFPINFEPPKEDKFKITPDELKEKLSKCFTASSHLAKHSFPFILDKLTAT